MKSKVILAVCALALVACGKAHNPKPKAADVNKKADKVQEQLVAEEKKEKEEQKPEPQKTEDAAKKDDGKSKTEQPKAENDVAVAPQPPKKGKISSDDRRSKRVSVEAPKRQCTNDDSLNVLNIMMDLSGATVKIDQELDAISKALEAGDKVTAKAHATTAADSATAAVDRCDAFAAEVDTDTCTGEVADTVTKLAEACEGMAQTEEKLLTILTKL